MEAWVFPGQGSQRRGMGRGLFERFPEHRDTADSVLGYSVKDLCLEDPDGRLRRTEYAQPALYVVNTLSYLDRLGRGAGPAFLAGHSLGEYNALLAAGCFDFATGLRLVRRRGELMAGCGGGGMAAVIGLTAEQVAELLASSGATALDVANHNSPTQVVVSGPREAIRAISGPVKQAGGRLVPLNVSAAFHSRYMREAASSFDAVVRQVPLADPATPVIANVTALPYQPGTVSRLLVEQIHSPVRWWESMRYLAERGVDELAELGPGETLTGLWRSVHAGAPAPAPGRGSGGDVSRRAGQDDSGGPGQDGSRGPGQDHGDGAVPPGDPRPPAAATGKGPLGGPERLGSARFREAYGIRYAYLAGSMFHGVASAELVVRMGKAGLMGFFGAGGLPLAEVEKAIVAIQRRLGPDAGYGMNLLHSVDDPALEEATADLYLRHGVRFVEAAGFVHLTPPVVRFRFAGAHRDPAGRPVVPRHILAKVSRPEVAAAFMRPPGEDLLKRLVAAGQLTAAEADVARELPVSDDICVEADSGGHTDGGVALTLLPSMIRLRDEIATSNGHQDRIRVGVAGGLGSPEAIAAAFVLGADFVVTGSVNQCSPEAGTSADVKDLLATLDVQDTAYAPAGDMFELGARVQVVRKGTLFPARANKLYQLYRAAGGLEQLDQRTRRTIEETYFRRSFAEVWRETTGHYTAAGRAHEIERAERDPRHKMALVFKWYFAHSTRLALEGVAEERVNYQIHCGPAAGAFNRFVRGTSWEDWRNRHVDAIAELLMDGANALLERRLAELLGRLFHGRSRAPPPCSILDGSPAVRPGAYEG